MAAAALASHACPAKRFATRTPYAHSTWPGPLPRSVLWPDGRPQRSAPGHERRSRDTPPF
eukprot:1035737-Alexandrium_andersonii.AAC.1